MGRGKTLWVAILAGWGVLESPAAADPQVPDRETTPVAAILIDDFEAEAPTWMFVGGEEFPGAKGSSTRVTGRAHGGKASALLEADFRGGGAYVGIWKDLEPLRLPEIQEFRFWNRSRNLDKIGVRIVDDTGQCHQATVNLPPGPDQAWGLVVLKVADVVGGEHWGGSNDGKWHGPPRGLGLNIAKTAVGAYPDGLATLGIDDLIAVPPTPSVTTLLACSMAPGSYQPGFGTRISYEWNAEPLGTDCNVFVHFVNAQGQMVFQADHETPVPTSRWTGRVSYVRTVVVPSQTPPGRYDVVVGLWEPGVAGRGGIRKPFGVREGLMPLPGDACRVGTLEVSKDAPLPMLAPPSLDLSGYRLTFDEDFTQPLSVSAWGPETRWIAHTPYAGDFGDAAFADPEPTFPFTVIDGILRIEGRKEKDTWRSGLLCSVDPKGEGFSQKFGYFEMRARLPKGPGTWPAFWLMGVPQLTEPRDRKTLTQIEIDVVEQYGVEPNALHTTIHRWGPGTFHRGEGDTAIVTGMTDDFHMYGVMVEDDFLTFYFDGVELRKDRTPDEAKVPLYLMVNLALGGGWPIDQTPNPSIMLVDYVRAYSHR